MIRRLFLSLAMVVLFAGVALAQTGSVVGVVVDANGNPVDGARVTLMGGGMGGGGCPGHGGGGGGGYMMHSYQVLTGPDGSFEFLDVAVGTYRLGACKMGVGSAHLDGVEVVEGGVTDVGVIALVPKNQMGQQ